MQVVLQKGKELISNIDALKAKINKEKIPQHIAIIMDGNGRWAKSKGHDRIFGHQNAIEAVHDTVEGCAEIGVKYLTLYAFSTENWNRPKNEVSALMELLISTIHNEIETLNKNEIRLQAIGDLESLPGNCFNELSNAIKETSKNKRMTLVLALSYSAKWEILKAINQIVDDKKSGLLNDEKVDDKIFSNYLSTANMPDPELMIRTSGEYRISNFLLWQLAYAELKFFDKFWPDFRKKDLYNAIIEYQGRERRFGKISEQIVS